jgi:hypothetical protein
MFCRKRIKASSTLLYAIYSSAHWVDRTVGLNPLSVLPPNNSLMGLPT